MLRTQMFLELLNFRCYRGLHNFNLDDRGITLISGSSGVGKTSIVMAIFFVITGNSPPKVISDGCDHCRVTLQWNSHTIITRTKRPNRVIVRIQEQEFEDDLAQTYIYQIFGRHFEHTSYVQQQYQRTFVYLSPTDKLEILERLCFDQRNPEELKKQCSVVHRELQQEHFRQMSRLRTLQQFTSTPIDTPLRPPEPPAAGETTRVRHRLEQLRKELKVAEKFCELQKEQDTLQQRLDTFSVHVQTYTEAQLVDLVYLQKEIRNLIPVQPTWTKHSKEECDELIRDYTRDIEYLKEHQMLTQQVQALEKYVQQLEQLQKERERIRSLYEGEYQCPECRTALVLMNDELVHLPSKRITRSQSRLSYEQKKEKLAALDQQIELLSEKTKPIQHFQTRCAELETLIDPTEEVHALESDLEWVCDYVRKETRKDTQNQMQEDQANKLQHRLEQLQMSAVDEIFAQQLLDEKRRHQQCFILWKSVTDQLCAYASEQHIRPLVLIEKEIEEYEILLKQFEKDTYAWTVYDLQLKEFTQFQTYVDEIKQLESVLKRLEQQMNATLELRQLVLKTESEIIEHKVKEIAELVNEYADKMFTEPITVELKTLKKTQTNSEKVQVQLEVFYKNMQCDVSLLSGGEQARLNLAFILAFAHVFHSPLLLLDECTSNLDQELTETVLEHIEAVGITKVVLIAHQLVEGNFAQILKLK